MCKYCESKGGITCIIEHINEFDEGFLVYIKNNNIAFENIGDCIITENINYCPICGEKLGED